VLGGIPLSCKSFLFISFFVFPAIALSQEIEWENIRAIGGGDGERCSLENVQATVAGGQVSFLFQKVGIFLAKSSNPFKGRLAYSSSCNVEAEIKIPAGFYINTITQSLTFGAQKDVGPSGGISTNGFLFQTKIPLNQINVVYSPKQQIFNAFEEKQNTQYLGEIGQKIQCEISQNTEFKTKFKLQILAAGAKPAPFMSFIVNVDASDVVYALRPQLFPCN
jgi:hypothetical protein